MSGSGDLSAAVLLEVFFIELSIELQEAMRKFHDTFGDIVPLRQIPTTSEEEILVAIEKSLEANRNLLPELLGFGDLEKDTDILM